jgi:hypothetical protein
MSNQPDKSTQSNQEIDRQNVRLVTWEQSPLPGFDARPFWVTGWDWDIGEPERSVKDQKHS